MNSQLNNTSDEIVQLLRSKKQFIDKHKSIKKIYCDLYNTIQSTQTVTTLVVQKYLIAKCAFLIMSDRPNFQSQMPTNITNLSKYAMKYRSGIAQEIVENHLFKSWLPNLKNCLLHKKTDAKYCTKLETFLKDDRIYSSLLIRAIKKLISSAKRANADRLFDSSDSDSSDDESSDSDSSDDESTLSLKVSDPNGLIEDLSKLRSKLQVPTPFPFCYPALLVVPKLKQRPFLSFAELHKAIPTNTYNYIERLPLRTESAFRSIYELKSILVQIKSEQLQTESVKFCMALIQDLSPYNMTFYVLPRSGDTYSFRITGAPKQRFYATLLGDLIFFPLIINKNHWILQVINRRNKTITTYDSLPRANNRATSSLFRAGLQKIINQGCPKDSFKIDTDEYAYIQGGSVQHHDNVDSGIITLLTTMSVALNMKLELPSTKKGRQS